MVYLRYEFVCGLMCVVHRGWTIHLSALHVMSVCVISRLWLLIYKPNHCSINNLTEVRPVISTQRL